MTYTIRLLFFLLYVGNLSAEESYSYKINNQIIQYQSPKTFDFITTAPKNYWQFLKSSVPSSANQNLAGWSAFLISTGVFMVFDEEILKFIQTTGRQLGFGNKEKTRKTLNIGDDSLIYAPTDLPSAIFFLGDGWTSLGLGSAFLTSGLITKDPRTLQTSSQLFQGLLLTGFSIQILKRATGRETPNSKTQAGGTWRPFRDLKAYHDNKSRYDSYPSAHVATAMSAFTIVSQNYPDYYFIKPLGYSLMALISFQAVNYGYHWASDIPLSLAMGHMIGKTIVDNGRKENTNHTSSSLLPFFGSEGRIGATFELRY